MQIRSVECVDSHGVMNTQCDPDSRPNSMQECSTGISCTSDSPSSTSGAVDFNDGITSPSEINRNEANLNRNDEDGNDEIEDQLDTQQPKIAKKFTIAKSKEDDEDLDDDEDDDDSQMQGDDPSANFNHQPARRHDDTEFERQQRLRLTHLFRSRRTDRRSSDAPNEPT